jgi:hypothetical protein
MGRSTRAALLIDPALSGYVSAIVNAEHDPIVLPIALCLSAGLTVKIFVSYAGDDRKVAEPVAETLRAQGHEIFFDRDSLQSGAAFDRKIRAEVEKSDLFLFLISPLSVTPGKYSLTELSFARQRNLPALPVLIAPTPADDIPAYLKSVTILQPIGNVAAEVSAAVDDLGQRGSMTALKFAATLGFAAFIVVFIAQLPDLPLGHRQWLPMLAFAATLAFGAFYWSDRKAFTAVPVFLIVLFGALAGLFIRAILTPFGADSDVLRGNSDLGTLVARLVAGSVGGLVMGLFCAVALRTSNPSFGKHGRFVIVSIAAAAIWGLTAALSFGHKVADLTQYTVIATMCGFYLTPRPRRWG